MGIMVMTVSVACANKGKKAESETQNAKNIINGSESMNETETVSKTENSKEKAQSPQNTELVKEINTEQAKPDKTDIQNSLSTENETTNGDEKNSDVIKEENSDYYTDGGDSDVSDNSADEYDADEPDDNTHEYNADEQGNDTGDYETDDGGNKSGDSKDEKPKVDAGWIYYVSSAKNGMSDEQKAYFDSLVGKWTRKEITDGDMSEEFLHTFDEWGFDTWTAGVTSDERCLFNSVESIPDYNEMVAESQGFYNFIGLYTEGEYDDKGYLICYYWEAGTM